MAYRLQPGESVREGLRRIAREELSSAAAGLRQATARTRDDAIHEARKSVKKVRAILRLMRGELGDTYAIENRRLRDVARRLSVYRDGTVMIETLDQLGEHHKDDRSTRALAAMRRGLLENQRRQRRSPRMIGAMHRAGEALLAGGGRRRPVAVGDGWAGGMGAGHGNGLPPRPRRHGGRSPPCETGALPRMAQAGEGSLVDRKSTRLNSSHLGI